MTERKRMQKFQSTIPTKLLTKIGLKSGNNQQTFYLEGSISHGYFCIRVN